MELPCAKEETTSNTTITVDTDNNFIENEFDEAESTTSYIREGLVKIENPSDNCVFYNNAQVYNRDLSIIVIKAFIQMQILEIERRVNRARMRCISDEREIPQPLQFGGIKIMEPLAASGLRSIRYGKEISNSVNLILSNDLDYNAVNSIKKNSKINLVQENQIICTCMEGKSLMYSLRSNESQFNSFVKKVSSLPACAKIPVDFIISSSPHMKKLDFSCSQMNVFPNNAPCVSSEGALECGKEASIVNFMGLPCAVISKYVAEDDEILCMSVDKIVSGQGMSESDKNDKSGPQCCNGGHGGKTSNFFLSPTSFSSTMLSSNDQRSTSFPEGNQKQQTTSKSKKLIHVLNPLLFEVVDIDPYGSACEFIDAAVQVVRPGGILCLTSTDMAVLCGKNPEVSYYKYGGTAVKAKFLHEMSLRLLLNAVIMSAARYKRVAIPLLSCSIDFYVRVFVQIKESAEKCKLISQNSAIVHQCMGCDSFHVLPMGNRVDKKASQKEKLKRKKKKKFGGGEEEEESEVDEEEMKARESDARVNRNGLAEKKSLNVHERKSDQIKSCAKAACCSPPTFTSAFSDFFESSKSVSAYKFRCGRIPSFLNSSCDECGGKFWLGGPFYAGPLHDSNFVNLCLQECEKIAPLLDRVSHSSFLPAVGISMLNKVKGLLTAIKEELVDVPLYYNLPNLCNRIKINMIKPSRFKNALINLGYRVSHFHRDPQSIKTDAPNYVVFDILRKHASENPPKSNSLCKILLKPIVTENVDFTSKLIKEEISSSNSSHFANTWPTDVNIPKWLPNPMPFWGPKSRAKRTQKNPDENSKTRKKQNNKLKALNE